MVRLPVVSGRQVVRAFQRAGFEVRRPRGSHIIMGKGGYLVTLAVPDHPELKPGTLRALIRKSALTGEDAKQVASILAHFHSRTIRQRYWLQETPRVSAKEDVKEQPRTRERELRWLEANRGKLAEQYGGQWIVLEGQKLISHGHDAATVLSQARAKGIRVPFLLRISSKDEGPLAMEANHV